jgi:5-methylcytosine-specific restriction protein A
LPDRRSKEAQHYRRLYKTARWAAVRLAQLSRKPLCEWCDKRGIIRAATVCHHAEPHKGNSVKFHAGPFVSLCAPCHDTEASGIEARGYSNEIGKDGWAIDPRHPANR